MSCLVLTKRKVKAAAGKVIFLDYCSQKPQPKWSVAEGSGDCSSEMYILLWSVAEDTPAIVNNGRGSDSERSYSPFMLPIPSFLCELPSISPTLLILASALIAKYL